MRPDQAQPVRDRFWAKVQKSDISMCWPWLGTIRGSIETRGGYGVMTVGSRSDGTRKHAHVHRLAFELAHGRPPKGLVRHSCDNRICVNPSHLVEGTHADNMRDMVLRGRSKNCGRAPKKLTTKQVQEIRQLSGTMSQRAIGMKFGVAQKTVSDIVRRKIWRN